MRYHADFLQEPQQAAGSCAASRERGGTCSDSAGRSCATSVGGWLVISSPGLHLAAEAVGQALYPPEALSGRGATVVRKQADCQAALRAAPPRTEVLWKG